MSIVISKAFKGNNIRIITDQQGEPWFVAADIAKVLEYLEAKDMTRLLDDDEKDRQIVPTLGGNQEMNTINESGLYSAIRVAASRRPSCSNAGFITNESDNNNTQFKILSYNNNLCTNDKYSYKIISVK